MPAINITVSQTFKERGMDENPMRAAEDKRQALHDQIMQELRAKNCFKETIVPTGKKNEHLITITLSVNQP